MGTGLFLASLDYFPAYGVDKLGITDNIVKLYQLCYTTTWFRKLSVGFREMEECTESLYGSKMTTDKYSKISPFMSFLPSFQIQYL